MARLPTEKLPEERLSVPGRRSYSKPEDTQLGKESFFQKNVNFSWVGKGCLLEVDNQGHCCCCWAFSATEAITAAHAIENKGEMIPLSKQQLLDCMYTYYDKPHWFAKLEKNECFPSSYNKAYKFAMEHGIVEETKYPFTEERGECECPSEVRTVKIKGFNRISDIMQDKKDVENLIMQQPLTCAVPYVPSLKEHKGESIYMGPNEDELETTKKLIEECQKEALHAMLIVGYGIEYGVEFYLVKNSWGKEWGYKGFAKIERGVLSRLSYPIVEPAS